MIKLIGFKRVMILAVMIVLNLLAAGILFFVVKPMHEDVTRKLNTATGEISRLSQQIDQIKSELRAYDKNYDEYRTLENKGFFMSQDRFQIGRLLNEMRERSGLEDYNYKIEAIRAISMPDPAQSNSELISRRITLSDIKSPLDENIYVLVHNLATVFPQHTRVQKLNIKKKSSVSEEALRKLAEGNQGLIDAEIVIDWLTVISKDPTQNGSGTPGTSFRRR